MTSVPERMNQIIDEAKQNRSRQSELAEEFVALHNIDPESDEADELRAVVYDDVLHERALMRARGITRKRLQRQATA